ncbi:MAG TPA: UvrD-helicase domain-containing protein, partial [Acidimicrobiales bacterium]|nr:UvrD-helicase domain-containing protein [Acidimicrobiales bacterium]
MGSRDTTEMSDVSQAVSTLDEIAVEQDHLDLAYARLAIARGEVAALPDVLSPAERGGTHQDRLLRAAAMDFGRRRLETLVTGGSPLCFGRIDTSAGEEFHIGRVGLTDELGDPLIVDWRAPVAEPFYRATAREPMATRRRRHIRTRDGQVVAVDDEWLDGSSAPDDSGLALVGEAALMAAVTKARTGRMGDIVTTIQAEQDAAIRAPLPGVLVVAGGPGTGKTAVALHRAAYLLYTYRVRLQRIGVLVIGPNPVFLRYIEHVLPSLDERAVVLSTPEQLYDRAEVTVHDSAAVARLKGDIRLATVLAAAVSRRQRPLSRPTPVPFGSHQLVLSPKASAAIVERARERTSQHNDGRGHVRKLLVSHLYRQYTARLDRATPEGQRSREPVPASEFREALLGERSFRALLERIWPKLTPEALIGDLFGHAPLLRDAAAETLTDDEQELLLRARSEHKTAWSAHDLPLLDEAAALLGPVSAPRPPTAVEPAEDAEA